MNVSMRNEVRTQHQQNVEAFRLSYPEDITIETMDVCNLKCRHCYLQFQEAPRQGFMSIEDYAILIDRMTPMIKKAKRVDFPSVEGIFHPNFFRMLDMSFAVNPDLGLRINTNGMLLDERRIPKLLEYNIEEYGISLDGHTRETHEIFKTGVDFDRVISNIENFVHQVNGNAMIEIKHVLHKDNVMYLLDFVEYCGELGAHSMHASGLLAYSAELSEYCLYAKDGLPWVEDILQKAQQRANELGMRFRYPGTKMRAVGCRHAPQTMYVAINGDVIPCVLFKEETPLALLDEEGKTEKITWGNVFEDDPYEIWTGDASFEFRRQIYEDQLPQVCKHCAIGHRVIC
jgi:MoaA/NifB/PqqE/SkfB family radical SAM enzyme